MRLLVTGDEGLVGRALVARLREGGTQTVGFDVRRDPHEDILEPAALRDAMAGCDGVVHLAAISRVAWGEAAPELCRAVNVEGTRLVAEAAEDAGAFLVFASSREVYGDVDEPVTEDRPRAPVNVYGRSKADAEAVIEAAAGAGLRCSIVRLSNVYGGRGDHPDRAVPSLLQAALDERPLRITGSGTYFDFTHVDDVAGGLLAAIEGLARGEDLAPVHLASGVKTSLADLAYACIAAAESKSVVEELPARSFDVGGFCGDPARAADVLGWRVETSLSEGLARLRRDLLANGPLAPVSMPAATS